MSTTRANVRDPEVIEQAGPGSGYVLPNPGRGGGELLVPATRPGALQRHREAEVARAIGGRASGLIECQQQLLGELRTCLEEMADTVVEAARVRLQGQIRSALSVLEWCEAVQSDLQREGEWAARGLQPIELVGFCQELATSWSGADVAVEVVGDCAEPWWGHAGLLAETVEAGLALVVERAPSTRSVLLEISGEAGAPSLRLAGSGDAGDEVDPATARRFRQNAERLGARVLADSGVQAGTALILALPGADA